VVIPDELIEVHETHANIAAVDGDRLEAGVTEHGLEYVERILAPVHDHDDGRD
jgi:hypothetical protein